MESVYIETSVIGYLTTRISQNLIVAAHQQLTRDWWDNDLKVFEPFISAEVIREISAGDPQAVAERLDAIREIAVLPSNNDVLELADEYVNLLKIPDRARADAFHLAYSVIFELDYLATWNLTHIANRHVVKKLVAAN